MGLCPSFLRAQGTMTSGNIDLSFWHPQWNGPKID